MYQTSVVDKLLSMLLISVLLLSSSTFVHSQGMITKCFDRAFVTWLCVSKFYKEYTNITLVSSLRGLLLALEVLLRNSIFRILELLFVNIFSMFVLSNFEINCQKKTVAAVVLALLYRV